MRQPFRLPVTGSRTWNDSASRVARQALTFSLVAGGGGCGIRTREGLHPTRFPTMLTGVHRCPPPSANCANTIWVDIGERPRTGVNETETETRGQATHHGAVRPRSDAR